VHEIEARLRHRIQPGDDIYFDICDSILLPQLYIPALLLPDQRLREAFAAKAQKRKPQFKGR